MYEYYIKEEEQDMIVNKTIRYLKSKPNSTSFESMCLDICDSYSSSGRELSPKQMKIVGRIYYTRVYEYKKPTKKMIADSRKEAAILIAKEELENKSLLKLIDEIHKADMNEAFKGDTNE